MNHSFCDTTFSCDTNQKDLSGNWPKQVPFFYNFPDESFVRSDSYDSVTVFPSSLITISAPIIRTIPTAREIHAVCTKPATM